MNKGNGFLDLLEASVPGQVARTIAISMRLVSALRHDRNDEPSRTNHYREHIKSDGSISVHELLANITQLKMLVSGDPLVLLNVVLNNSKGRFALAFLTVEEYSKYKLNGSYIISSSRWFQDIREFRRLPSNDPVCVLRKSMQGHSSPSVNPHHVSEASPSTMWDFYFGLMFHVTDAGAMVLQSGSLQPGIMQREQGRADNHFVVTGIQDLAEYCLHHVHIFWNPYDQNNACPYFCEAVRHLSSRCQFAFVYSPLILKTLVANFQLRCGSRHAQVCMNEIENSGCLACYALFGRRDIASIQIDLTDADQLTQDERQPLKGLSAV